MLKDERQMFWKLSAVSVGISMPMVIFGPAVMGMFLILGIILGLAATKGNSLRDSVSFLITSRVPKIVALLLFSFFISATLSVNVEKSMDKMLELVGISVLALGFYLSLREMPIRHVDLTYQSLAVSTIVMSLLAILDAFSVDPRLSAALHGFSGAEKPDRLTMMGGVFAVLTPFLWAWLLRMYKEGEVFAKWLALPASVLSILAVFVSGSFTSWVALFVGLVLFTSFAVKYHYLRFSVGSALTLVTTFLMGPLSYLYSQKMLDMPYLGFVALWQNISTYFVERVGVWIHALDQFGHHVFFGTGVNTFKGLPVGDEGVILSHPHNFVVQILLETGVVGLLTSLTVIGLMVSYFWKASRTNLYGVAGVTAIVAFLISAVAHTSIFHPWWLTLLVFTGVFAARVGWAVINKK